MKTYRTKLAAILLAAMMLFSACGEKTPAPETNAPETPAVTQAPETESDTDESEEAEAETDAPESETEPEPETAEPEPEETETEAPETLPSDAELLTDPDSDIKEFSDESDTVPVTPAETKPEETEAPEVPEETEPERIYSYLNGYTTTVEERDQRPVAIMLNNMKKSLPQAGLCEGDIYYECAAEGGITRLMMVCEDYEDLGTVGSIRSSRDYFVDFLANHDAIYVHAGGSNQAYEKISWRGINNLDGVNMYLPTTFWRDTWRMNNIGYEHSMMANGQSIAEGIAFKKYRTELDANQVPLFRFYDEETDNTPLGSPASHIHMKSTSINTVDFVYNAETKEYLRYQYNGMAHTDATTGEQLSVKNVLILFTEIDLIPGDEAGRLTVGTVGSGQGYYITNGVRKVVNWSRETKTSTLHLEYRNGDELILNCGKTFICVVDDSVASGIDFEYSWN